MVADVKGMILFVAIGAVRSQEDGVGVIECRRVLRPAVKVGLDARFALEVGRRVEEVLEQDDVLFVFVGLFGMTGDRSGDEDDFPGWIGGEAGERGETKQQHQGDS